MPKKPTQLRLSEQTRKILKEAAAKASVGGFKVSQADIIEGWANESVRSKETKVAVAINAGFNDIDVENGNIVQRAWKSGEQRPVSGEVIGKLPYVAQGVVVNRLTDRSSNKPLTTAVQMKQAKE